MILNACAISRSITAKACELSEFDRFKNLNFCAYEQAGDIPGGMDPCLKLNIASGGRYLVRSVRGLNICKNEIMNDSIVF